ncbi:S4 domain-containing protein [Spiroplasma endosymbiont of Poecilobothrus nobilitatus]|uniref:S4 domain-containing protein n=1 Tax=Spiroplasma endosymbiont of Poecilobothrus nobilitatus TaxID=1209220 RepID=UPI00313E25B7
MLNKTQLLQHYQQDYELINKIKGWCEQARRGQVVNTDFLDLRQIAILQAILVQENIANYFIHKPLTNGFRATVSFNAKHDNAVILHVKQPTPHFFQHHQVLGFILNKLQLELRVIGDFYITANDLYLSVLNKITPVFINAPLIIQKKLLAWTINPAPVVIEYQFTVFTKTVKSLRLDAVASALCNASRQQAQKYVEQNYVYVNFSVVNNKTFQVSCDIIISIKRYGRFKINAVLPSKNQHYRITIAKFA